MTDWEAMAYFVAGYAFGAFLRSRWGNQLTEAIGRLIDRATGYRFWRKAMGDAEATRNFEIKNILTNHCGEQLTPERDAKFWFWMSQFQTLTIVLLLVALVVEFLKATPG